MHSLAATPILPKFLEIHTLAFFFFCNNKYSSTQRKCIINNIHIYIFVVKSGGGTIFIFNMVAFLLYCVNASMYFLVLNLAQGYTL